MISDADSKPQKLCFPGKHATIESGFGLSLFFQLLVVFSSELQLCLLARLRVVRQKSQALHS